MPDPRLPARVRAAVVVVVALLVAAVVGATAVVQVGASALLLGGGFVSSGVWSPNAQWAGIELANRSGTPLTLHAVVVRGSANVEVSDARVIEPGSEHLLQLSSPLTPALQAAVDRSRPVDGFVLPPHSRGRYEVVFRFRPRTIGRAFVSSTAIVYSAWGLDHGAVTDGVYCVRAPGRGSCPPFG